ncbi:MAG: exodeoxyribonuclease V subunit alpha [Thermodesulfobacteriota bacterium]
MSGADLGPLLETGDLSPLDLHFARLMGRLSGGGAPEVELAAALVSRATRAGHICLDLAHPAVETPFELPHPARWREVLEKSPVAGAPGEFTPLVLDGKNRLYLYRYWAYQQVLAASLLDRAAVRTGPSRPEEVKKTLDLLFGPGRPGEPDWQRAAALIALYKNFLVITGGPGTGKTTTVARILALLAAQASPGRLRVLLAAPTGKAAARLKEAVSRARRELPAPAEVIAAVPEEASTIHRLLGARPHSPRFRHHRDNPLPADVLVVDEASMVDLPLMAKVAEALPRQARLILLGDKDQLSSVEAGAVLADVCGQGDPVFTEDMAERLRAAAGFEPPDTSPAAQPPPLVDCIVELKKNYRFGAGSGLGELSRAVIRGDSDLAVSLLAGGGFPDLRWIEAPPAQALPGSVRVAIQGGYEAYLKAPGPAEAFEAFERFRILCALRKGPYGSTGLNLIAEDLLAETGLIRPDRTWYTGRPVMITANDYNLRLFNGDVGLAGPAEGTEDLRIHFPAPDGGLRLLHPLRLPEHETVYATTVHKSQGSEFDRVLLVLPDQDSPLLTRELVYTGLTRARQGSEVIGNKHVLRAAVNRGIERTSGLRDALWGDDRSDIM